MVLAKPQHWNSIGILDRHNFIHSISVFSHYSIINQAKKWGSLIFSKIKHFLEAPQVRRIAKDHAKITSKLSDSWKDPNIPGLQWKIVQPQIIKFKQGKEVPLFEVFCESIKTCIDFSPNVAPSVLEIGCSSGYHGFVLCVSCRLLAKRGVRVRGGGVDCFVTAWYGTHAGLHMG